MCPFPVLAVPIQDLFSPEVKQLGLKRAGQCRAVGLGITTVSPPLRCLLVTEPSLDLNFILVKWHLHNAYLIASLDASLILTCEVLNIGRRTDNKSPLSFFWAIPTHIPLTPPLHLNLYKNKFLNSASSRALSHVQLRHTAHDPGILLSWKHTLTQGSLTKCLPSLFYTGCILKRMNQDPLDLPMLGSLFVI